MKSVIVRKAEPISIQYWVFNPFLYSNAVLYVPIGSKELYQDAVGWKNFEHVAEFSPSSIQGVKANDDGNRPVYTLSGQRLTAPQKGINIINGKKVVIK